MPAPDAVRLELPDIDFGLDRPTEEKMCIIGLGYVGLGIAGALKRNGVPFDVLEADSDVGGNWFHGVYETVHIISSRKTTEYSDFPMPDNWPDFPSAAQMHRYLCAYADHFQLRRHTQFRCVVESCVPVGDGSAWQVSYTNVQGAKQTNTYKGVVVCIGHHWDPRMPSYPGQSHFTGQFMHSKAYKTAEQVKDRRVLVIGGGNSACDIAVEAARFGTSSHLSVRRGYWIVPRTIMGYPSLELMPWYLPFWLVVKIVKLTLFLVVGDYRKYGLPKPDHEPFQHHPTINSELLNNIRLGNIIPHGDIAEFSGGNTVTFKDGRREDFDLVVAATGFHMSIPMLKDLVKYKDDVPQLVGGLFLPNYRNLYISIGGQVRYGAGPVITAGAANLVRALEVQERCRRPLGRILQKMGAPMMRKSRKSQDVLIDPFVAFRQAFIGRHFISWLPSMEKILFYFEKPRNRK